MAILNNNIISLGETSCLPPHQRAYLCFIGQVYQCAKFLEYFVNGRFSNITKAMSRRCLTTGHNKRHVTKERQWLHMGIVNSCG